ncbi:hypothetical protein AKJ16_DCAP23395 [Drosera capensis]
MMKRASVGSSSNRENTILFFGGVRCQDGMRPLEEVMEQHAEPTFYDDLALVSPTVGLWWRMMPQRMKPRAEVCLVVEGGILQGLNFSDQHMVLGELCKRSSRYTVQERRSTSMDPDKFEASSTCKFSR